MALTHRYARSAACAGRFAAMAHIDGVSQSTLWSRKPDPKDYPYNFDIYDAAEVEALCRHQEVLEVVAAAVPDDYPTLSDVRAMPEWMLLCETAEQALGILMRRGRWPEDREIE